MDLLVVRHAIAEPHAPGSPANVDAARRLTATGKKRFRRGAKGLRRLVPTLDLLVTSPLARAAETAEILATVYAEPEPVESPALAPGHQPEALAQWLADRGATGTVAVVGHEPDLGVLVGWLLTDAPRGIIELKKGAACLVRCPDGPTPGAATLVWALQPAHLRRLRR